MKWKADEAKAKCVTDEAEAKQKAKEAMAEWVRKAEEAHKWKVSTAQMLMVPG